MNKRVSVVEPLPGWADKEAVMDNSSEAGDFFHKLEVKELSRESARPTSHTLYFADGLRRIDMILVFELDPGNAKKTQAREAFEKHLRLQGLETETESPSNSQSGSTCFMKLHAPSPLLQRFADVLNIQKPIKKFTCISYGDGDSEEAEPGLCDLAGILSRPFDYNHDIIPPDPDFFNAVFSCDRDDKYIHKDREAEFTSAQRSHITWQVLLRTRYDDNNPDKSGIVRLMNKGVYKAAFPLHEGRYDKDGPMGEKTDRRLLYLEWAHPRNFYKKQPLWLIKRYFGDKMGLYFAWLGFYNLMLVCPAIVGTLVFLYGLATFLNDDVNIAGREICKEETGELWMCPECPLYCEFTKLTKSCLLYRLAWIFDNDFTPLFAFFMALWAALYIELWKRRQAVLIWRWDLQTDDEEEQTRPEFEATVKTTRINPVSRRAEPYIPAWSNFGRQVFTYSFVLFLMACVFASVFIIIVFRMLLLTLVQRGFYVEVEAMKDSETQESVSGEQKEKSFLFSQARLLASIAAASLNLLVIVTLNKIYEYIAIWLVNWEKPRTQSDYEQSFTFKMFAFQFINFYSSLIYIAFFKGRFYETPSDFGESVKSVDGKMETSREFFLGGMRADSCDNAGCFFELSIQLIVVMLGKQVANNIVEFLYPKVIHCWKRYTYRKSKNESKTASSPAARWEQDYNLQAWHQMSLFDEYLEMVIQFGFITIFVSAFPLAPLLALINNVAEVRLDAYKYTTQVRRPLAQKVQSIGAWAGIMQAIVYFAIVSNAIIIAHTTEFIPRLYYQGRTNGTLAGYVNQTLTAFNTSGWDQNHWPGPKDCQNASSCIHRKNFTCYFKGMREPAPEDWDWEERPWEYGVLTKEYITIVLLKFVFVVVFEHLVFFFVGIIMVFIPDVPTGVKLQVQREKMITREEKFSNELKSLTERKMSMDDVGAGTALTLRRFSARPDLGNS